MSTTATETKPLKMWQGINQALVEEMERDERVVLVGEDVGRPGGPYGVTRGLQERFGELRVRDTPISEQVLVGLGVGAGAVGLRPVVELMFFDFALIAMDQIVNQAAKFRYFSGESLPLVIRTMCGAGGPNGAQHSQNFEAWYCAVPGLKVVMPSNAADAKGLLKAAIRDDDPVLFIETLGLLTARREVPQGEEFLLPIGVAETRRAGDDVTVVAIGRLVDRALEAAETLAQEGISVEVIDPRTLAPLDAETIVASIARTGRLVVAQEATAPFSFASEVCTLAAERCLPQLKAPPVRVASPFVNVPTPVPLAESRAPGADAVVAGIRRALEGA
ncbi:pyruvate dehydrogenase complex E1 component subunit beta [Conexibacter sp. JD483]|uniref:alpha-ketoacid dehydrogenase subunit beta n=1 Tax=unclassified Conexibacter TaxID=2627773 RepID=UPI002723A013|nr:MULTISPECIES: pyruvate dehydrogenase complex E1 component subunit beta [unclassified Conexibacter]MDO8187825.1 pyruvate dehydrogenase complex E1 component subunit beta [Conexibacter sp. CPCC 205706]MDO8199966.1 pyruvate dehydrogenase complex E1 component subunit beta [Conexibacter sp. CPCC 205762]MDR9369493.1 pyruvate dehydrogenase complex E1 component subunit beta [Conexibacter sp. JD483]